MASPDPALELQHVARRAGLHHVCDECPGIRRHRRGQRFEYRDCRGRRIRQPKVLARIAALAIPPAWSEVWICPDALGHLQATGRDARGRKQYRYHSRWRQVRDQDKYQKLMQFEQLLPVIHRRVATHLRQKGLPRARVLAGIVRLLERTLIRVGNNEYAATNASFGLTTFRDEHIEIRGSRLRFHFQGKSGIHHEIRCSDAALARLIQDCRHLPGRDLFQYVDELGTVHDVTAVEVNDYLREITDAPITAKDFRTWAGTRMAAEILGKLGPAPNAATARRHVREAIERVAERLGNTAAVCRKCYIHPAVLETYLEQRMLPPGRYRRSRSAHPGQFPF